MGLFTAQHEPTEVTLELLAGFVVHFAVAESHQHEFVQHTIGAWKEASEGAGIIAEVSTRRSKMVVEIDVGQIARVTSSTPLQYVMLSVKRKVSVTAYF